ncbi:uncharacterized protein TRAVEDRAFT_52896 [Trametes versicolor FP-101664 SS1]|uniref:uncharacterized protein n=1 Tax=Trametes versicolor (strain FP-101664) TaxID=717944 RepID=UPI0004621D77|nr:uncharacterized protein TRAVEDRAFT_52896 [Trametes versicolor FP-101664 SS1]EIW53773.1 hypothetical protein TRAVEDRAFT_52896 [Trametes versicolor FP-101664 SS1]
MSNLSWFWDQHGVKVEFDGIPASYETWLVGSAQQPDSAQQMLLDTVEAATATKIVRMDLLAKDENLVVKVEYEDGRRDIVRSPLLYKEDGTPRAHCLERFWREDGLLRWLETQTPLPVPKVRYTLEGSGPGKYLYSVIEVLPGTILLNAFGRMPYTAKECAIRTHAEFAVKLFRLDVPQRIGSLRCTAEGIPEVIPQQTINPQYAAPQVFDTLEAYIDFLISRQLRSEDIGTDDVSRRRSETILTRFATQLSRILVRLNRPEHRRCVLSHDDLNHTNVLVDEAGGGAVSGVIDWEHQSTLPAVLAAQYPLYIRSGDSQIPAGHSEKWIEDSGMISPQGFSLTSPEDEASLLEFYANAVKSLDEEYWEALVEGALLRSAVEWLGSLHDESDCAALERWMDRAFPAV